MTVHELNIRLGNNIKHYRELRNWTSAKLARKSGIHYSLISIYENGHSMPGTGNLIILADVLGIEVSQLFEIKEKGGVYA